MSRVYLAGAIHHVTPHEATIWRRYATLKLEGLYEISDPTADKDLFRPDANTTFYVPEHIVRTDIAAIDNSDIILAEVSRTNVPYHGTSMEIMYAAQQGKKVYVWGGCNSYWVRYHATKIFLTLDDAIKFLLEAKE